MHQMAFDKSHSIHHPHPTATSRRRGIWRWPPSSILSRNVVENCSIHFFCFCFCFRNIRNRSEHIFPQVYMMKYSYEEERLDPVDIISKWEKRAFKECPRHVDHRRKKRYLIEESNQSRWSHHTLEVSLFGLMSASNRMKWHTSYLEIEKLDLLVYLYQRKEKKKPSQSICRLVLWDLFVTA